MCQMLLGRREVSEQGCEKPKDPLEEALWRGMGP